MEDYEKLPNQTAQLPGNEIIHRDIETTDNWRDAYRIGKAIYEHASGEADKLIMDAYEKAFGLGLNIRVNREYFLTATQQLARIYFQFQRYEEAVNMLMVLDSNMDDLPDWVNLYYASAQIHTENILYWAEVPQILFRRIDRINTADEDSVKRRQYLYLEFLNRLSELSKIKDVSRVDKEAILNKAAELEIDDSRECSNFKIAFGIIPVFSELPEAAEPAIDSKITSNSEADYKQMISDLNERLTELQAEIVQYQETIEVLRNELRRSQNRIKYDSDTTPAPLSIPDILTVNNFLPRRQKILIIGGSEAKENHLRGKLKNMGFDFVRDQLEFELEYDNVKDYASRIKPWSGKYAGIIVGPCPHKAKDIDGYSSFIEKIKTEEGYPHVEEARDKAGTLKITNASIVDAMMKMAVYLQSIA